MSPTSSYGAVFAALDRFAKVCSVLAVLPIVLLWGLTVAFVLPRGGQLDFLRLHYIAGRGVDWVGDWRMLFVFPVLGTVIWVVNRLLAARLARTSHELARLVMAVTVVIEACIATGGTLAVLLNG